MIAASLLILSGFSSCAKLLPNATPAAFGSLTYRGSEAPLALTGAWERYNGYINDAALASSPRDPEMAIAKVRTTQFDVEIKASKPRSYRMRIRVDGALADTDYSLTVPSLSGIRAIYANGRSIFQAPPVSPVGRSFSSTFSFNSLDPEISIVIQVEPGFPGPDGGGYSPRFAVFGLARDIDQWRLYASSIALILSAYFAFAAVFVFILFIAWRHRFEFLGFALFMATTGIYMLFRNSAFIPIPLPGDDRFVFAANELMFIGFAAFYYTVDRGFPKIIRIALLAAPALIMTLGLSNTELTPPLLLAALGYQVLLSFLVITRSVFLAFRHEKMATTLLISVFPIIGMIMGRGFFPDSLFAALVFEPAGLVAFSFAATALIVGKVSSGLEEVAMLNDYVANVSITVKRFIPKEFLDFLDKRDVVDLRLGDHVKKKMTIFFSDIRAFTELSERLTIEENFAFINSYLSRVVPIITDNDGFVDKYIGDAIMALFNGPRGADSAIKSAVEMQSKIVEYNGHRAKMGYKPIAMGVGIHTGDLMLGVVGVSDRMENTVISDAVNLASRLQAITKAFNISLAISEQAFKELADPGQYKYRFIGKVKVKGKAAPVSVFEIFDGIEPSLYERKMKANTFFEQGMLSYYQKDFAGAMYYFKRVLDAIPEDGAAAFYLETCINKASL